ncbi:hypothetical protein QQ008_24235 [Fulvivirgaceae bacterium BMA10]|uniref:Uncharacterized protein n=1 Tax=Splendidivirga corallicola TaxID=3051826 RepID=A0ABT8KVV1_9BACT|nr:hypothetical protein [Fulvivirgaceae bacterium BMA10]
MKQLENEEIIKITKPKTLFDKFYKTAATHFVKTSNGYLMGLHLRRSHSAKFEILDDNPLIIQFENGKILMLYPRSFTEGRFIGLSLTYFIVPFYKITEEDLEVLVSNKIENIRIYFTSDKVSPSNRIEDDLGTYFQYDILSEKYKSNCMIPANCIVQN